MLENVASLPFFLAVSGTPKMKSWRPQNFPHRLTVKRSPTTNLRYVLNVDEKLGFCDENYTSAQLLDRQMLGFLGLYEDQNIVYIITDTINRYSMELRHKGYSFPFHSANITCMKTHLFHGVCSNMCIVIDGLMLLCWLVDWLVFNVVLDTL